MYYSLLCSFNPLLPTDIIQTTFLTIRLCPGRTHIPPMINKTVAKITSLLWRNYFPQLHLHLFRLLHILYKPDAVTETDAMRVCHDCRLSKYITHNQIRALSSNARQLKKCVKIIRHMTVILIPENFHTGTDIPRLTLSKSAGSYNLLNVIYLCLCQGIHIRILGIKLFYHNIYPCIRTLRRQADTDQKLPCLVIIKGTACIRIFFFQSVNYLKC